MSGTTDTKSAITTLLKGEHIVSYALLSTDFVKGTLVNFVVGSDCIHILDSELAASNADGHGFHHKFPLLALTHVDMPRLPVDTAILHFSRGVCSHVAQYLMFRASHFWLLYSAIKTRKSVMSIDRFRDKRNQDCLESSHYDFNSTSEYWSAYACFRQFHALT